MKVLINAYAISPNKGSEPGMGWNWIVELSKIHNLYIITESEFKTEIESKIVSLQQKDNLNFYFIDIGLKARKMCWNQGDWRFYFHYHAWQKRALQMAKQIIQLNQIDVIHQLNMVGYREPGLLWKINGIPKIWGPVGGFGGVKLSSLNSTIERHIFKQLIKNVLNKFQIKLPYIQKAINNYDAIVACNSLASKELSKYKKKRIPVIHEVGTRTIHNQIKSYKQNQTLNLIWIGRNIPTKGLNIAIKVMKKLKDYNIRLKVIGVSENTISEHSENIEYHSWVEHKKVKEYILESHLLFFTSVFEATGTVVLEALSNGLPVICHDTCGQGDIIDNTCGIKIPLNNFTKSVKDFEDVLLNVYQNPQLINALSIGALNKASELTWSNNSKKMKYLYEEIISNQS
ncbi:glycosyltransferase family 4 protein [Saccharicrinis sp. FJH54]|uniref:glycosyltransferase family 4 protein n=1 Tax=Saccharicrinis sp. FJH54 TaxID=3344665 RepID=UPI0035D433CE